MLYNIFRYPYLSYDAYCKSMGYLDINLAYLGIISRSDYLKYIRDQISEHYKIALEFNLSSL